MSTFKQPLVYDALLLLYRTYWVTHQHLPRAFRMTSGEAILQEITACIKQVILANNAEKQDATQRSQSAQHLGCARASLVVIRGLLTLGWGMAFIAHGAFMRLTALLDSAEKQITRWQGWFMRHNTGGQHTQ
ncbi:hypothetical protein [Enterobacter sp. SLBN-59]|uniref:hypothetical protein n=1 Tax=Enterobacter sp. SLBN-59 TaxID=2940621 RepID=UPI0021694952|nr:hypothetical protein [Enterobacter sp. SLBN-59]MCS3491024.1 hypothetical protein [Enterobacter sp. SLBN-59]